MPEVINLEYNASTEAFVVHIDALGPPTKEAPNGVPLIGVAMPAKRVTLTDLDLADPTLASAARALLVGLHDHVRAATTKPPTAAEVAAKEAALAAREEAIVVARQQVDAEIEERKKLANEEVARQAQRAKAAEDTARTLEAEIAARQAEKARLDLEIAQKQAEAAVSPTEPAGGAP